MRVLIAIIFPIFLIVISWFVVIPYIKSESSKIDTSFTLVAKDKQISLDDFKGKVLAIYFGYTSCPDVCPTSLSLLGQALSTIDKKNLESITGIFVSVDPKRDKVKELDDYAKYFHKNIIGATASKEIIDEITSNYGTYYYEEKMENSYMDYTVNHTSKTYILDKNGELFKILEHNTSPKVIRQTILDALNK